MDEEEGCGSREPRVPFKFAAAHHLSQKICAIDRVPRYRAPLVLEGGSIHVDGEGTCLVTEECLLHRNRREDDPHGALGKAGVEAALRSHLGVSVIIWLGRCGARGREAAPTFPGAYHFVLPIVAAAGACPTMRRTGTWTTSPPSLRQGTSCWHGQT